MTSINVINHNPVFFHKLILVFITISQHSLPTDIINLTEQYARRIMSRRGSIYMPIGSETQLYVEI